MKHYSIELWSDHLRGLVNGAAKEEMDRHLASGCPQCRRSQARIGAVQAALQHDIVVPERHLALARAIFASRRPQTQSFPRKLAAILTFDSFRESLAVGFRGVSEVRRLAYAVEDVSVELLVETRTAMGDVALTGQISMENPSGIGTVRVIAKKKIIGEARATDIGEFQTEFRIQSGLRLVFLEATGQREIEIPLDALLHKSEPQPGISEDL